MLRQWQDSIPTTEERPSLGEHAIFDGMEPMTTGEIDASCESLNFAPEPALVVEVEGGLVQDIYVNDGATDAPVFVADRDPDDASNPLFMGKWEGVGNRHKTFSPWKNLPDDIATLLHDLT